MLLQGWIQQSVAAALLKRAGFDYETVKRQARTAAFRPIDLKASFSADIPVNTSRITSHNVIGKLTGSKYPNETISYGGHWDAFGIGPADAQGRTIRPGAADDALGLAAMLEDARLFASGRGRSGRSSSPPGPARSAACSGPNITPSIRCSRWKRWSPT